MTQEQQDVLSAITTMTTAFEGNDISTVMDSYEPQAVVVFEPEAPVGDPAQLKEMFASIAALDPAFGYTNGHEVIVTGDVAIHIAPWKMSARTPDGLDINQAGLSVAVLRKQADGRWKIVIDNPHGGRLLGAAD